LIYRPSPTAEELSIVLQVPQSEEELFKLLREAPLSALSQCLLGHKILLEDQTFNALLNNATRRLATIYWERVSVHQTEEGYQDIPADDRVTGNRTEEIARDRDVVEAARGRAAVGPSGTTELQQELKKAAMLQERAMAVVRARAASVHEAAGESRGEKQPHEDEGRVQGKKTCRQPVRKGTEAATAVEVCTVRSR
jgi:hypothetical protein